MRLVANELRARGFDVDLPAWEDGRRLSVERWGIQCNLSVHDFGLVEWECEPWPGEKADPILVADIAAFLLTGSEESPRASDGHSARGMTLKAIAGNELRDRGFTVSLDVYEDLELLEVDADIVITNSVRHPIANVRVSDDADLMWECNYRCGATGVELSEVASSIASTVAHAMRLSSGASEGDC
jgi:hypothetical protein